MSGDSGPTDESDAGDPDDGSPPDGTSSGRDESPADGEADPGPDDGADRPPGDDRSLVDDHPPDGERSPGNDPSPGGDSSPGDGPPAGVDPEHVEALGAELDELRTEVDQLRSRVDEKTVHRDDVEAELRRYVRARQRRGHATGWGPYLVLLYGVVMTLGAFFYLGGPVAIVAMIVVWLSTLGLYVVMAVAGAGIGVARRVASLRDVVGNLRG